MAQNVVINSVVYQDCPEVDIPVQGGGTARFIDTTLQSDGATAADQRSGKKSWVNGQLVVGSLTTPVISQDATTKVLSIS